MYINSIPIITQSSSFFWVLILEMKKLKPRKIKKLDQRGATESLIQSVPLVPGLIFLIPEQGVPQIFLM